MQVPASEVVKSPAYLEALAAEPDEPGNWELGAQANVLVSAARLGLRAAAVCSLGDDAHGAFLRQELKVCVAVGCPSCRVDDSCDVPLSCLHRALNRGAGT